MKWFEAAERGNIRELERFLRAGQKVDAKDSMGFTALVLATENGHAGAVELLLKHKANPKLNGPAYFAIDAGRADILQLLLDHGLDPNGGERDMDSYIEVAAAAAGGKKSGPAGKCLAALIKAGGKPPAEEKPSQPESKSKSKSKTKSKPKSQREEEDEGLGSAGRGEVAARCGTVRVWDFDTWDSMAMRVGDDFDALLARLKKSKQIADVRDVTAAVLKGAAPTPAAKHLVIVKLKGQAWALFRANWGGRLDESVPGQISRDARLPVIWVGHQDTAGVSVFHLYENGEPKIRFESMGLEDAADTRFKSDRHKRSWLAQHEDENEAIQALLREQQAYVPFFYAYDNKGKLSLQAIPEDTLKKANVERIVILEYA